MNTSREYRRELRAWLSSLEPQLYATHNFGYCASFEARAKALKRFYNRLQRRVHGRNWSTRTTDRPMVAVGFWEHLDSNPHCHVLVAETREEYSWLLSDGDDTWLQQERQGQLDVSRIKDLQKVISYVTKCAIAPNSLDNMFVYKAPLSKHATQPRSTYPWND